MIAISGTTSALATQFVVMVGTESFKGRTWVGANVSGVPMASGSAAMKARWANARGTRVIDIRYLSGM
jgi:hypothetical protein